MSLCCGSTFTGPYTFSPASILQTPPAGFERPQQPNKPLPLTTLRGLAENRHRFINALGNIPLCYEDTEGRPGQRGQGPLTPADPSECAADHGAVDEVAGSWTEHWVTFGVTRRTADGCVFNPISGDQLTNPGGKTTGRKSSQRIIECDQCCRKIRWTFILLRSQKHPVTLDVRSIK